MSRKHEQKLIFFYKLLTLAALLILNPISAICESDTEIAPEDVTISTPVYHPEFSKIDYPLGTYKYTVSWQGIPAAEASINVQQEGLRYKIIAKAKTYSGIDVFYKLRYTALGLISAVDFSPIETQIDHQENSRLKTVDIKYLGNGDISTVRTQKGKNTKSMIFDPRNFTLEPISAGFLARGLDWEIGKNASFDTFNGKTRYLITLSCVDKKIVKVNDQDKEVWIISPKVQNLTNSQNSKKLREAFIYLTTDANRDILLIKSEVFIGNVTTELDSFAPSGHSGQAVAQIKNFHLVF